MAVSLMATLVSCNDACKHSPSSGSLTGEAKPLPFMEVSTPKDGELFTEGTPINLKFGLPKEVSQADSIVVTFNDATIDNKATESITIPTKGLKMGRQTIRIRAFVKGDIAAEKYMSVRIKSNQEPVKYTYSVVKTYPHDTRAYTQGLTFDGNTLYEGTGQRGESNLRIVDLNSGSVTKSVPLPNEYFGEGIAIIGDKVFQITWQEQRGFVYDKKSLEKLRDFVYAGEGWGLTTDGKVLFLSDGTSTIKVFDPERLVETSRFEVYDNKGAVQYINEMEYINGEIWANIYMTDNIVRFDPSSGKVLGYIDFKGILPKSDYRPDTDVLNGIAYHKATGKIYVTGKYWPKLFEVKVTKK